MTGLRRPWFGHAYRLAIDCSDNTVPASERLLKGEFDIRNEMVALTLENGVLFLSDQLADCP